MDAHILQGIATGGGIMGAVGLAQTLLAPYTQKAANKQAADKMLLERENALRNEAEKMRTELRAELIAAKAEVLASDARADKSDAILRTLRARCRMDCENMTVLSETAANLQTPYLAKLVSRLSEVCRVTETAAKAEEEKK